MKVDELQSHGPGSSLVRHTLEVCGCARSEMEKGAAALHDLLKGSAAFQEYSQRNFQNASPHRHAGAGAWVAWRWLLAHPELCQYDRAMGSNSAQALAVAQAVCGHHSHLDFLRVTVGEEGAIRENRNELIALASAVLAELGLPSDVTRDLFPPRSQEIFATLYQDLMGPHDWLLQNPKAAADLVLDARSFLGRLVLWDHASARAQTFQVSMKPPDFSRPAFELRQSPDWQDRKKEWTSLDCLRSELLSEAKRMAHASLQSGARLLLVSSPTGTGKTNAMLEMAEEVCRAGTANRIVYALPLLAIADQVYADYLSGKAPSQIYNHLRQETSGSSDANESTAENLDQEEEGLAEQPFGSVYNVTSFHQVLKALLHPNRLSCAYLEELRDSVLIFDEFHRFPPSVLPPIIQLLECAANRFNMRVVLGSATPFPDEVLPWRGERVCMASEVEERLLTAPEVTGRRVYAAHPKGRMTAAELAHELRDHVERATDKRSLLVLVNPLREGTLAIAAALEHLPTFTEREFALGERKIFYLDSAIPPWRRAILIDEIKCRLRRGEPLIVISTPILEIGVDIDFAEVWEDFVSIATTLQRGGRCNREGNLTEAWCRSFELRIPGRKGEMLSSRDQFRRLEEKHDDRRKEDAFRILYDGDSRYFRRQTAWFRRLKSDAARPETELLADNTQAFAELLEGSKGEELAILLAKKNPVPGFDFEALVLLYDLYAEAKGATELLIFEDSESYERWQDLREANDVRRDQLVAKLKREDPDLAGPELQESIFRERRNRRLRLRQAESRSRINVFLDKEIIQVMAGACFPVNEPNVFTRSRSEIIL